MKKKDFERLGKRLLPEFPGFTVKGELLFIQPIGHTLRAICFDGSSFDAHLFFVHVFVQPLFVPGKHVAFNLGWRIGGGSHRWDINAANLETELSLALKREALPFLNRIKSPRDVVSAVNSLHKSADLYAQQAIAYSLARAGDIEEAAASLDQLIRTIGEGLYPWQREMAERAERLKAMLLTDPAKAQRQLEAWEFETLRNLGLEKFSGPRLSLVYP